jgi:glucokinase
VNNKKKPEKHSKFIGVDVGGTNVRAGLVQNGKILALQASPISSKAKQEVIVDEICQTIAAVLQPDARGIGIGVPSLVDVASGIVYSVHNIPSWRVVPLKKMLEHRFRLPVFVNNDANCFMLGEFLFGMARGYRNIIGLVVGTGLGTGVVINGKLYSGSNGGAGEIGAVAYNGKDFEYFCSGQFFLREFGIDAATLQKSADGGDRKAREMFAEFGDHFAEVIMTLLYAYDPELIVLGGSINKAYPYFRKRMSEKLRSFDFQISLKKLAVVQTKKPNIAVLGAAALCLDTE